MDRYTAQRRREYTNDFRASRKMEATKRLGGRCSMCGSTAKLEFDHIDPASKTINIAKLWTASRVRFEAEVSKCQLLCKACHIAKSQAEGSLKTAIKGVRYIRGSKAHTDGRTAL
jgi:5-methylcytosine-specific restriction endonuclease McrA